MVATAAGLPGAKLEQDGCGRLRVSVDASLLPRPLRLL